MSRFRQSLMSDDDQTQIDISPLIDCVFILLIFFIVSTVFVEESGVEVDKPQAASAESLEKNSILLAVTADGQVVYGGRDIGVQGVQSLIRRMVSQEKMPVIIQPDAKADAQTLIRVLDESKLGGAEKVSFATVISRS